MFSDPVLQSLFTTVGTYMGLHCLQPECLQFTVGLHKYAKTRPRKALKASRGKVAKQPKGGDVEAVVGGAGRPVTPYIQFCKNTRPTLDASQRQTDTMKILGRMWKELGAEGQRPFQEAFAREKEQYRALQAGTAAAGADAADAADTDTAAYESDAVPVFAASTIMEIDSVTTPLSPKPKKIKTAKAPRDSDEHSTGGKVKRMKKIEA